MLQPELIRAKRTKTGITPLYAHEDKGGLAKTLIIVYREHIDKKRTQLNEALSSCEELGYDFRLVRGLSFILDACCIFGTRSVVSPITARRLAFEKAANTSIRTSNDRYGVLESVASGLGATVNDVDASLYADLPGEQQLTDFKEPTPIDLLNKYNFALVIGLLSYARSIVISYVGKNPAAVRAAESLGSDVVEGFKSTKISLSLKPTRQLNVRGARLEPLIARLLATKSWTLKAEVSYPIKFKDSRPLELSSDNHGGLLLADQIEDETVIELKATVRKRSFGDIIVIDDVTNRLGITDKELIKRIESEKVTYSKLPGVLITPEKLNELRVDLDAIPGDGLNEFRDAVRSHGGKNYMPILEALGYIIEQDRETKRLKVYRLKKRASS